MLKQSKRKLQYLRAAIHKIHKPQIQRAVHHVTAVAVAVAAVAVSQMASKAQMIQRDLRIPKAQMIQKRPQMQMELHIAVAVAVAQLAKA
jgi:hypothetical protein